MRPPYRRNGPSGRPFRPARVGVRATCEKIDAAPHCFLGDRADVECRLEKRLLDLGVERDRFGPLEHLLVDAEMNRRFVVCGRGEDAALGSDLQAEHRRRVEVREEYHRIVGLPVSGEVIEQRRAPWALLLEPRHLIVARMRVVEDPFGVAVEGVDVPRMRVCEAPHGDAVDALAAFGILVRPRDVVARAGGQHLDVVLSGHALGNQPAVVLGAAENLYAVSLDDKGNSHWIEARSPK